MNVISDVQVHGVTSTQYLRQPHRVRGVSADLREHGRGEIACEFRARLRVGVTDRLQHRHGERERSREGIDAR